MEPQNERTDTSEATQPIHYSPLETPHTIRVIQARRLSTDGHIVVNLKHISLSQTQCPEFTAISYVWGEKKLHPQKVIINGRTCQVLESIYPILALICDERDVTVDALFWIDYLCINQDDSLERAAQVTLMGTLYQRAHRTLVWLGEDTPDVQGAIDLLKFCASDLGETVEACCTIHAQTSPEKWQALRNWMKRPWLSIRWTRVWTLQEFLLPSNLSFYCGNQSITRSDWRNAIKTIYAMSMLRQISFESLIDQKSFGTQWARRRLLAWYEHSTMGLFALMAYIGDHDATDDRDRVYAILGICSDTERAIVGTPNYDFSVEELYTQIVVSFMRHHKSLNILCHRALFTKPRPDLDETAKSLPTWVPDWRRWTNAASRPVPSMVSEPSRAEIGNFREIGDPRHDVVDPQLVYAASAGLAADFTISRDKRRLTCKGIVIDFIDGLGPVGQYGSSGRVEGYSSSTLVQSTSDANTEFRGPNSSISSHAIMEHFVRSLSLDRAGRYLMWPADVDGYVCQLLKGLRGPAHLIHEDVVVKFISANSDLLVAGASLGKHIKSVGPLPHKSASRGKYSFWRAAEATVGERGCRLITTVQGRLGMASRQAIKGGVVALLIGCSVPVVLRKSGGIDEYEVVGEAFMPEFMRGEEFAGDKTTADITLV